MIKRNLDLIFVGFLLLALILWEETFELSVEFFELMFELLHTMFEWVEMGVDGIVEKGFHLLHIGEIMEYLFITERHASQVVTFYILMSFIGYGLYKLSKYVPRMLSFFKQLIVVAWVRRKTQVQLFWYSISQWQKVMMVISGVVALYLASFFII